MSLPGTVEAAGTYRTSLKANAASKDRSEQAPWRSYYGLASPAPGTCPPRISVSMLGRGRVQLPRPALAESLSQCDPGSRSGLVRGSLGLAQLGSRCRKLKRQEKEGQVEKTTEEERKGGREANAPGCCTRPTRTACAGTDTSSPGLPAFSGCQRMENDLRGGDWASPPDLNLSDKTRVFRKKKKSHTTGAMNPSFRRRGVVASIWKLQALEAAAALPATLESLKARKGLA